MYTSFCDGSAAQRDPHEFVLEIRPKSNGNVLLKLLVGVSSEGHFRWWSDPSELRGMLGEAVTPAYNSFSDGDVAAVKNAIRLEGIASAAMLFIAGPEGGVVECRLRRTVHSVDLYRPNWTFLTVRLDQSNVCDLREVWDPLEIHTIGEASSLSRGRQCAITGIYTDYPRSFGKVDTVSRFKLPADGWERSDSGDLLVNSGTCVFANPQRTAVEIVCHEWAGIIIVRRGLLLNVADLYSSKRCTGAIFSESCDIAMGASTGLGVGGQPFLGAFLDIFNP